MEIPRVQYAKTSDGVDIAFTVFGQGPPLVITPALLINHVQRQWEGAGAAVFEPLAERATVVRYDPRGMGMSQRDVIDFSLDAAFLDLEGVVARAGLSRFALFGVSWSGYLPLAYAARWPNRVSHLALWWQPPLKYASSAAAPWVGRWKDLDDIEPLLEQNWDLYTEIRSRLMFGWDSPGASAHAALYRATHSPQSFRAALDALAASSPEAFARDVHVPTLILHSLSDQSYADAAGSLAAEAPNAQLAAIPGPPNGLFPNAVGLAAILDFINSEPSAPGQPIAAPELDTSAIKTMLFTDIEEHTAMMQRLGDARGREVLREHERISREALYAHGGAEIKTIGDSFMASFPSAQKALECALALQRAFASTDTAGEWLRVRVGINAGEPIAEEDDLFGSSVILAARTARQAQGGEILVTDVVRQLVTGKGFLFVDRGEIEMRGFEDPVRLYEVRWQA